MRRLPGPLVRPTWLLRHLADPGLCVLDCRWTLGVGARPDAYAAGHVPGAVFIDLEADLAGPPGAAGRHPLPDRSIFEAAMSRAGVDPETTVVAYDDGTGSAARCWWMLRAAGHAAAAVLDGGLTGWVDAGGGLTTTTPAPRVGRVTLAPFSGTVDADAVAGLAAAGAGAPTRLLDARAPARYRGELEPVDPRPGHIPGARNLAFTELFPDGRLLGPSVLAARLDAAGVTAGAAPVVYCGSGVSACMVLLALAAAGIEDGRLYPGSWSEWSGHPDRPAVLGPSP
ncbi:MAG TPA: sulfurtransferase [Candidatus Micrarchaeia archaeon]|nr:sulfurtransferase [Candidatus Micrarchaeia archaeon]